MKFTKIFFLPLLASSSFLLNHAVAASETEKRVENSTAEVRQESREGMSEAREGLQEAKEGTKKVWKDVKKESKEMWSDSKSAFNEGVLEGKLAMAIALNKHLNPFDIDIDVDGNRAVLDGKVSSEVERDLAESIASGIEGVATVDNRLSIEESLSADRRDNREKADRDFSQFFADVSTTASIKTELLANDSIKGLDINVDTYNDRVTLSGDVQTEAQKSLAESIAKKRDDVTEVINDIQVNSRVTGR